MRSSTSRQFGAAASTDDDDQAKQIREEPKMTNRSDRATGITEVTMAKLRKVIRI